MIKNQCWIKNKFYLWKLVLHGPVAKMHDLESVASRVERRPKTDFEHLTPEIAILIQNCWITMANRLWETKIPEAARHFDSESNCQVGLFHKDQQSALGKWGRTQMGSDGFNRILTGF